MEGYDEDDDTHFCIKCHSTITGLDNYVTHRQSGCRPHEDKYKAEVVNDAPPTPTIDYPEILNADAFFSSLELRSSVTAKLEPSREPTPVSRPPKHRAAKRKRKYKEGSPDDTSGKEKLPHLLPGVTDLDDLAIPSLVGFPDIVASTSKASTSTSTRPVKQESVSGRKSTETFSHRKSLWLEDANLNEPVKIIRKFEDPLLAFVKLNDYDYRQDDESEAESLLLDLDEDTFSDSNDAGSRDTDYPPQSHTGGKWKPGSRVSTQDIGTIHEDDVDVDDEDTSQHPPSTFTGGKWKPSDSSAQKSTDYENKGVSNQRPPPGHTRGKWVPGARADIGAGYWCAPCGRKLASRLVYNRHLLSDLHARRSVQEIDGALHIPRGAPLIRRLSRRQTVLALTTSKPSRSATLLGKKRILKNKKNSRLCILLQRLRLEKKRKEAISKDVVKKRIRQREKEILSCEMCHARVRRAQMGKHLLSHYHCRVAGVNPQDTKGRRFLLENMANIVRQCPFQCASCRFYCNTEETFLRHWRSTEHQTTVAKITGSFRCTPCDFWCNENEDMETHILGEGHRDVISMINSSVPIVIGRQQVLKCSTCCRSFRYNFELRMHKKESGHEVPPTATDEYQSRIICKICGHLVRSLLALQRHQLMCHKKDTDIDKESSLLISSPYFCSFCSKTFKTAEEAVKHRRTVSHKEIVKMQKTSEDMPSSTIRDCPHCDQTQNNLIDHKNHLLKEHPLLCHRCPKCGKLFALSQDVARHSRDNQCTNNEKENTTASSKSVRQWSCTECSFQTEFQSEFLFHKALHKGVVETKIDEDDGKVSAKYQCPLCEKNFSKTSLRDHIRNHTREKPFPCGQCSAMFSRRSARRIHRRDCPNSPMPASTSLVDPSRKYHCAECGSSFHTKHVLRQHMLRHAGKKYKCGLPGCPTILRTETELKMHRKLVHEASNADRKFQCNDCSYAAKTKTQLSRHRRKHETPAETESSGQYYACDFASCTFRTKHGPHLKRHKRLHSGVKPYKCRHCPYACNNLENLRKHVTSTNLHPGKSIYECHVCTGDDQFETNFIKELRAHLLHKHPDKFPNSNDVTKFIASLHSESEQPS